MWRLRFVAVVCCLALGSLGGLATASPGSDGSRATSSIFADGRSIVGAKANGRQAAAESIRASGGTILSYYGPGDFFIVRTPSAVPSWVASIQERPGVRYAEPDFVAEPADTTPDDPMWGSQWGPAKIGAPTAWETSTGSPDVTVAVIDSGIDYGHEDLASQMWTNPLEIVGDGIDNDGDGYIDDVYGTDCRNNDGDPMDDFNHGTHVAGIIGAAGNNGIGISGVGWNVRLMALKFLGAAGTGVVSDAVECIDYAIQHGASLTNNSWVVSSYSQALSDAVSRARAADQLFVAAAGNSGKNTDSEQLAYPASYSQENVISVASTDSADVLGTTSSFGPMSIDLAAPGVGILSTYPGNRYETLTGTSMAAPHVSGAAAVLLSAFPSMSYREVSDRLLGSVDRLSHLQGKVATGGRLDLARAIEADMTPPGNTTLTISGASPTSLSTSWISVAEDGSVGGPASSYDLRYRLSGTEGWAHAPTPMPADPGTVQSATISGLRPGRTYDMSLVVTDNVGNVSAASAVATTTPGAEILVETAEGTSLGWSGDAPWAISSERVASPIHSWTDSPGVPYATSVDRSLRSPSFSLETATQPQLSFWHLFNIEQGFDFGTVLISTDGGTGWTEIARYTGGRDLSAVVLDLSPYAGSPDVRLRFRLQSDSVISFDGWYIDDIIVTARDTAAPRAPENLTASVGDGAVTLDWADNSEPDLAGYLVYRTTDPPDASPRAWTSIGTPTLSDFIDDGVATGVPYFYRVSAVDTSGNESPPSGEIQAEVADTTPPGPPGGLMATAGNLVVTLDWADNTESDVAGYIVYRSADPPEISSRTWTSVAAPTSSAHADSTVVNGTTYFYRVTALDASGNESSPSGEVAATPTPPIGSFAPDAVTISKGSTLGDPLASLAAADDAYFRVASTRSGTNHFVDWFASSRITAGAVTRLMVTYEGSWSSPTAQSLSIRDFSNGRWETISSATVATADVSVSWSTGTASPYISAQGEVRLRVVTKSRTSVTCRADLIRVTVQY